MANEPTSRKVSFQKKVQEVNDIPGARLSLKTSQLNISSGIPSLDYFMGGGLTVGTVILLEEDKYATYSNVILKYFLAEGVVNKHGILLSSGDKDPKNIIEDLPALAADKIHYDPIQLNDSAADSEMKIAWRYKSMPRIKEASSSNQFGHQYILGKTMDPELIKSCSPVTIDIASDTGSVPGWTSQNFSSAACSRVAYHVQETIKQGGFDTDSPCSHQNILRVAIHSLGSPIWVETDCGESEPSFYLLRFLYLLKALMRSSFSVALVTVPAHTKEDKVLLGRMRQICDAVINLESFEASEMTVHPAFKDYNGLIKLVKVPHLNTLKSYAPNADDLAFRLHRRSFSIEKFHLPPLLDDEPSRSSVSKSKMIKETLSCSSNKGNFDF